MGPSILPTKSISCHICYDIRRIFHKEAFMQPDDRKKEILEYLEKNQYMSVEELARAVFASEPTIRRDLAQMEREGLISRKRGGASFISSEKMNFPFAFRNRANIDKKNYIAGLAAAYQRHHPSAQGSRHYLREAYRAVEQSEVCSDVCA